MPLWLKIIIGLLLVLALLYAGMWLFFGIIFKIDDEKKKKESATRFLNKEFSGTTEIYDYAETSGRRRRVVYIHGKNGYTLSYEMRESNARDEFIASSASAFKRQGESAVTFVGKNGEQKSFEYPFD